MIKKVTKNPNANINGTSFHRDEIYASYDQLVAAFGEPCLFEFDDKVTTEWWFTVETDEGEFVVTLYDWKEGFAPTGNIKIYWHIGGKEKRDTTEFRIYALNALSTLR